MATIAWEPNEDPESPYSRLIITLTPADHHGLAIHPRTLEAADSITIHDGDHVIHLVQSIGEQEIR